MNEPDIWIVTALSIEARPLIDGWGLRRMDDLGRFERWQGDAYGLIVSGVGPTASAAATAALLTHRASLQQSLPLVVNLGFAGSRNRDQAIGELVLVNRVRAVDAQREFIPEILFRHELPEGSLGTHSRPVIQPEPGVVETDLVDMEAAGFLEAARAFLPIHRAQVIKLVSDHLDGRPIDKAALQAHLKDQLETIELVIAAAASMENTACPRLDAALQVAFDALRERCRLTDAQSSQVHDWLIAAMLRGQPTTEAQTALEAVIAAPPAHKRERNALVEHLRDALKPGVE
ncbi:MAG: hypothetical protein AAFX93_09465 [Verrucomicrobiota bacterium]